ncbi:DUF3104 domain-containing protein [Synechococcus sp. RSCCF101]|uniref:DUF3104 domain-containing protein n=1 Tax=Synechococcus sp. RSCCF101 TaxID=2511069 RepID=UPI0012465535|nr:DUF3104 domain-containing protein [Synechococcus sp. RSCCF101]QEY33022.1 DUF3104 domain-containing protein [Synechococcus sp. RSCCF101]
MPDALNAFPEGKGPEPAEPAFLKVRVGDTVRIAGAERSSWLGTVLHTEGGARGPEVSFLQVACQDTGIVHTLSADAVLDILPG